MLFCRNREWGPPCQVSRIEDVPNSLGGNRKQLTHGGQFRRVHLPFADQFDQGTARNGTELESMT